MRRLSRGLCVDCDTDTVHEDYMVHRHVWKKAGMSTDGGLLCIGCLEQRLGRELWSGDFTHWPINNVNEWEKSERLKDRLTRAHRRRSPGVSTTAR